MLALLGRGNGVGVASLHRDVGVGDLLNGLQRIEVLLVLNHEVVDGAGEGVLVHFA